MDGHRLVRREGTRIITTSRARRYLMANLSMIHDERKVPVFDLASRRTVGTLDESFVVGMIHPGSVFITKGQLWRVLDTEEGRITVEPAKRAKGELPSWEGEQIPVPYAIAQEVGALRRTRRFGDYIAERARGPVRRAVPRGDGPGPRDHRVRPDDHARERRRGGRLQRLRRPPRERGAGPGPLAPPLGPVRHDRRARDRRVPLPPPAARSRSGRRR